MNKSKKCLICLLLLISFIFGITTVDALSTKQYSNKCQGYQISGNYRTYAVLDKFKSVSSTKAGGNVNSQYIILNGVKTIIYCVEKGHGLNDSTKVPFTAYTTVDAGINSASVSEFNKGALARFIAYGRNGKHTDCTSSTYDRVAGVFMAHMINKCVIDSGASVCTNSGLRWDYLSDSAFAGRVRSLMQSTDTNKTKVANYATAVRTHVLQHGLVPSFTYSSLDIAKKNARYLTSINTTSKNNPVFGLSLADSTKAHDGKYTLQTGLWSVSSATTGLSASISGNRLNVSTGKNHLNQTLCVSLKKTEKTGTLYKNTSGQDTVYLANPTNKTVYSYVCVKTNFIKVNKINANDNKPLNGTKFNVFEEEADCNANNNPVKNVNDISFSNQDSGDSYSLGDGNTYFYNVKENASKEYYVREVTPTEGYRLPKGDKACQKVTLNDVNGVTFKNTNVVTTNVQVIKKDKYSDDPIKGVKLGLYDDNKCSIPTTMLDTSDDRYQKDTDLTGQVLWYIDYTEQSGKKLYVKEESLPTGYVKMANENNCYEVEINKTTTVGSTEGSLNSITIYNMPYGNIRILKRDITTKKPIKGASFRLLDENKKPATDKDGNLVNTAKTDSNGNVLFTNILYGTYYIEEVNPADKYKILDEPIKMILNKNTDAIFLEKNGDLTFKYGDIVADNKVDSYDLDALNSMLANSDGILGLSKTIEYASDVNTDGFINNDDKSILQTYLLYSSNNEENKILNDFGSYDKRKENVCKLMTDSTTCDTDSLSLDHLNNLNGSYKLLKEAASGIDTSDYTYDEVVGSWLDKDGNPVNDPTASFCTDTSGLKFKLGDVNGDCLIDTKDTTSLQEVIVAGTTDQLVIAAGDVNSDGKLTNADIEIINTFLQYKDNDDVMKAISTFVETKKVLGNDVTPNAAEDISKIGTTGVIPRDEVQASILITNEKINIKISKKAISGSKEIPGAKLVLRNSSGNIIKSFTSKKVPTEFYISAGKYTLTETVAPVGYQKINTVISFRVGTDGNIKLLSAKSNNYKIIKSTGDDVDLDHIVLFNRTNKEVAVPDTASNIQFVFIALGLVLMCSGGYVFYKRFS